MGWRIVLWAALLLAALVFLYFVRGILLPFIIALLVAAVLEPSVQKLRRRGFSRIWAVVLIFASFGIVVAGISIPASQIVGNQLVSFRDQVEGFTRELKEREEKENIFVSWRPTVLAERHGRKSQLDLLIERNSPTLERFGLPTTRRALIDQYVLPHQRAVAESVGNFFNGFLGIAQSFGSQLLFLLLTPLLVLMILLDVEQVKRRTASWIPPSIRAETVALVSDIGQVFVNYLRGVTIAVVLYMVSSATVLTILGAPYSILLGILFGAIYLVPYIGAIISYALLFAIAGLSGNSDLWFIHFQSPWTCALVITLIYFVFGTIFDQIVYPNVVGRSVGLHPVISMFVIFSGGALFGLIGMLLAYPLAGSIKVILDRLLKVTTAPAVATGLPAVPLRHRSSVTT